jgi:hypothetical protein
MVVEQIMRGGSYRRVLDVSDNSSFTHDIVFFDVFPIFVESSSYDK